jgi:hypothetical protein
MWFTKLRFVDIAAGSTFQVRRPFVFARALMLLSPGSRQRASKTANDCAAPLRRELRAIEIHAASV